MKLLKTIPFEHDSIQYEIRILLDDKIINTVAFHQNHPVNGFRYHIQNTQACDPERMIESDTFKETVAMAKRDIIEKRWERLQG